MVKVLLMDITLINKSTEEILALARSHKNEGQCGKASSFYFLLFHKDDELSLLYKHEFIEIFKTWTENLISQELLEEFSSYLETTLSLCQPIKTDVLLVASEKLVKYDYIIQAKRLLMSCNCKSSNSLDVKENIEQINNYLVPRWHFRMLNDKKRNLSYFLALKKAYECGSHSVIDIGSGTGLLR